MANERTVMMIVPGEGEPLPVPVSQVARARKEVGAVMFRPDVARFADRLPLAGAMLGGARGGPGLKRGAIQAGLGTAGKLAQEGIYRAYGMGDAPGSVLGEAATQTGAALVGEGALGVARKALPGVVKFTLPASTKPEQRQGVAKMYERNIPMGGSASVERFVRRLPFGNQLVESPAGAALFRHGSGLSKNLTRPKLKGAAQEEFVAAARARKGTVANATRKGITISMKGAIHDLRKLVYDKSSSLNFAAANRVKRLLAMYQRAVTNDITPSQAQKVITEMNKIADPIERALRTGGVVGDVTAAQAQAEAARRVASRLSGEMSTKVPGWEAQTGRLSDAISVKNIAQEVATHPTLEGLSSRLATGLAIGGLTGAAEEALGGGDVSHITRKAGERGLMGAALFVNPTVSTRLMLLAKDPRFGYLVRQSPAIAAELMRDPYYTEPIEDFNLEPEGE